MPEQSLISIICPLHNKGKYVAETIQSVVDQSHQEWELLVVENGSSDDGPEIVSRIDDPRVQLTEAPESVRGPGAARNVGLDRARGQWVLFLDADDLIDSNHLQDLLSAAESPNVDLVASGWREFKDSRPDDFEIKEPMGRGKPNYSLSDHAIAFAPWAIHCALVRKRLLGDELRWIEELDQHASEDTAFWFQVLLDSNVAYSENNSAVYRVETENFRNRFDDVEQWFEAMDAVVNQNLKFMKLKNYQPNAKQCENLMRLWADVSERAAVAGNKQVVQSSAEKAQHWMDRCTELGGAKTVSLKIRKWLGVNTFRNLKMLIRPQPACEAK